MRQLRAICVWNEWVKYKLGRCKMKPGAITQERTQFSKGHEVQDKMQHDQKKQMQV